MGVSGAAVIGGRRIVIFVLAMVALQTVPGLPGCGPRDAAQSPKAARPHDTERTRLLEMMEPRGSSSERPAPLSTPASDSAAVEGYIFSPFPRGMRRPMPGEINPRLQAEVQNIADCFDAAISILGRPRPGQHYCLCQPDDCDDIYAVDSGGIDLPGFLVHAWRKQTRETIGDFGQLRWTHALVGARLLTSTGRHVRCRIRRLGMDAIDHDSYRDKTVWRHSTQYDFYVDDIGPIATTKWTDVSETLWSRPDDEESTDQADGKP